MLYKAGVQIVSVKSIKAKQWLKGRENSFDTITNWKFSLNGNDQIIWVHCASLGEFEQAKPLIENVTKHFTSYKVLLTFFSPSGYEIRKNYPHADAVFYLPMDGRLNAKKFIDIVKPSLVIWVKYEYWYYYLTQLKSNQIPVVLVSAIFRNTQPFFKWYGSFWKKILKSFTLIFVQNESSKELLNQIGFADNIVLAGDTRFDTVANLLKSDKVLPSQLLKFCANSKIVIAGSTWQEDEEELVHYARKNEHIKFIIAPHEVDGERITEVYKIFPKAILFSNLNDENSDAQILIIDNIGLLSSLYKLATVTYIGGGFNSSGIHNILEAAVYGKPIIFGPVYEKFKEAVDLVEGGGAFSTENALELEALLDRLLQDVDYNHKISLITKMYTQNNKGATELIIQMLQAKRLLIN
jgi:3-deoxy-D-manno-octulosonic-acid transferase